MSTEITITDSWLVNDDLLNAYEEFSSFQHKEKKQITDFIQYAYSTESPYVRQYEFFNDRLSIIFKNHPIEDKEICEVLVLQGTLENIGEAQDIPNPLQLAIEDMISCYLSRIQHNYKFELYITYQTLFSEYTQKLRSKVNFVIGDDKALKAMETKVKITQPASDLIVIIDKLRKEIFGDNKRAASISDKKISRTPEYYASLKKK